MKMKLLIYSVTAILIFTSCSVSEPDDRYTSPAGIDSISITKIDSRSIDFLAHIYCGSLCWEDFLFISSVNGNEVELKLHVSYDGNPCPEVCVEKEYPYHHKVLTSGTYTFRFWQNNSTSIDTTITFN